MAFLSKVGNILRRTASKHLNRELSASRPSIFQAIRCMSSSKVFVGGLSYSTDETSLGEAFGNYGQVVEARVIVDRETGRSRGFGFVTFTNSLEASSAIQALDGQDLHGRRVHVNYAHDRAGGRSFGGDGNNYGGNYGGGDSYGASGSYRNGGGYNSGNYGAGGNYGCTDDFGDGENYGSAGSSPGDGGNQGGGSSYAFGENQGGGGSYGTGGNFGGDGSLRATGNLGVGIDSYGSGSGGNYNSNFGGSSYVSGVVAGGHDTSSAGNFNSTGTFGSHGHENHQNYGVAGGVGGSDNFASHVSGFGNNKGLGYTGGDQFGSSNMGNASGSHDQNEPVEGTMDDDSGVVAGGHDTSSAGNFNSTGNFGSHRSENDQNYGVAGGVGGSDNFASDVSDGFGNNAGLGYIGGDQFGSSNMGKC